jgi:hypothetical protein
MDYSRVTRGLGVLIGLSINLVACSPDSDGSSRGTFKVDAGPGIGGLAGFDGRAPAAVSGSSAATGTNPPLDPLHACATGMLGANLAPVNMFVMFDRSGSMDDDDKWPNATAALVAFFENPGSAGLRVALRFFPHDQPAVGCTEDGCDADACSRPLVELAALTADRASADAQEQKLVDAIAASAPGNGGGQGGRDNGGNNGGGGTPIYPALQGALKWSTSHKARYPDEKTVVVFVTDGEPNGCEEDFDAISELAADALASNGITTYAIGLAGSSEAQMDQLAQAGGTQQGIFIDNSAGAQQELLAALNAIRGMTLSCDFAVPMPAQTGAVIDPKKINITYSPATGSAMTLGQVPSAADCAAAAGWHYDNAAAPTRVFLCPSACDLVRRDQNARLQILLGCATEVISPD